MPKQVKVQAIQPDQPNGPVFGQVSNPADFMKSQIFAHQHTEINARDFVVGKCATRAVAGFDHSLPGGMQFRVTVPGQVIDVDGKSYEIIGNAPVDMTIELADDTDPRVDLIVVALEIADAADDWLAFIRLRTQQELDDNAAPYPPQQFNQPTEIHYRAVVQVKTGTPGTPPVAADLSSNEEPLYAVLVPANATEISRVTDLRNLVASNCELQDRIDDLRKIIQTLPPVKHRHDADEVDIDPNSPGAALGATAQDAFDKLALRTDPKPTTTSVALRPEILRPDVAPYAVGSGKLGSSGAVVSGTPVARIPYPRQVAFSTGIFDISPNSFVDQSLHPRVINTDPDAGDTAIEHVETLTLGNVIVTDTDGGGDWTLKAAQLSGPVVGHKAAARDGRYIEIFGINGGSGWATYDSQADTLTPRTFTGNIPTHPIIFAAPCGDGRILIATTASGVVSWYVVNPATGGNNCTALAFVQGPGSLSPANIFGDLIDTGVIFLYLAITGVTSPYWVFHTDTNTFEQLLTVSGAVPFGQPLSFDVCLYKPGQALLFQSGPAANHFTSVFDFATRSITDLKIIQPVSRATGREYFYGPRLANCNGRPQLFGDEITKSTVGGTWELTPGTTPAWRRVDGALPLRYLPGVASLLSSGLPQGRGFMFGGQPFGSGGIRSGFDTVDIFLDVWAFSAGGIVQQACGLTLGEGTRSATLRLPDFQIPWTVERMVITLLGNNLEGRVRVLESFDDGAHLQEIPINQNTVILNSNANPNRQLFLVLTGTANIKPCIAQTHETFEKSGGGGLGMVYLIYDCPPGTTFLYMDDKGKITSEGAAVQTTKQKAILHRLTKNGGSAPTLFDFLNKVWFGQKYEGGPKSGGVDPTFANDLAVLPSLIECWKVASDGTVHLLADCTVNFNGSNTVTGLANGESYRVTLAG